jgi:FkbM family methyltransferase
MKDLIKIWDEELIEKHIGTEIRYLQEYFSNKKNLNYIDIGANVGKFYDVLSKFYQIDNVFMVEPAPQLFEYISEKFKEKPNCKLFNFAISNENGETYFQTQCIDNSTTERIDMGVSKIHKNQSGHLVKMVSGYDFLNDHVNNLEEIDFIKLDTETHDYLILESIIPIIEKLEKKPFILFEHNYHSLMSDQEAERIINEFTSRCQYESINFKSLNGDCFIKPL